LWEWLSQELQDEGLGHDLPCQYYGLRYYPRDWERHSFWYMAGIELPESGEAGTALAVKTLPPSQYARFTHTGSRADVPLTLDYIFYTWLPKSGQRWVWPFVIEQYPPDTLDTIRIELPIEPLAAPPRKENP
jgi:predicted transcriptional regulator YdeE